MSLFSLFLILLFTSILPKRALCNVFDDYCLEGEPEGNCYKCEDGFYINDYGFCNRCNNPYGCKHCHSSGECNECADGYFFQYSTTCSRCQIDFCVHCKSEGDNIKCTECLPEYFVGNDNKCSKCNEKCLRCNGAGENQCTQCKDGYYPTTSDEEHSCSECATHCKECHGPSIEECDVCSDGWYKSGDNCYPCDNECKTCADVRNYCTSCKDGFVLDGHLCVPCTSNCKKCSGTGERECLECMDGYYKSSGQCQKCYGGCSKCKRNKAGSVKCTECIEGYVAKPDTDGDDDTVDCYYCQVNGCSSCPSDATYSECTKCLPGYALTAPNTCTDCDRNCATCVDTTTKCTSCHESLFLDLETNTCRGCSDNCLYCDNATYCYMCKDEYYPLNGKCEKCDETCLRCHDNTNVCDECKSGYYANKDNTCTKCPENCIECNSTHCLHCASEYYVDGNSCKKCADVCEKCHGPTVDDCESCDPGYYYSHSTNACFKCNDACETCYGMSEYDCRQCAKGYFLNRDSYRPPDFQEQVSRCQKCEYNCINCSDLYHCHECEDGYRLFHREGDPNEDDLDCQPCKNKGCKKCDSGVNECTECLDGYYVSSTDNNKFVTCSLCPSNCHSCKVNQNNVLECLECSNGFYLSDGQCLRCTSPCATCTSAKTCTSCINGHLFDGVSSCSSTCSSQCLSCENTPETCTSCNIGYILSGTKCLECYEGCETCEIYGSSSKYCTSCLDGYYSYKEDFENRCTKCNPECATCHSGDKLGCTSCAEGYYFTHTDMRPGAQYAGVCSPCNGTGHEHCQLCLSNCNDDTAECHEMPICTKCDYGYYIDDNDECKSCDVSCDSCIGPSNKECIECKKDYFLFGDICTNCSDACLTCDKDPKNCTSCQPGKYVKNGVCEQCSSTCSECQNKEDYCTKCTNNYWAYEGSCYKSCYDVGKPVGANVTSRQCYDCPALENCISYDDACQCTSCKDGFYLVTDQETHDEYCQLCQLDKCKTCNGAGKNDCTECIEGFYLYTYSNTGAKECKACQSPCTVCSTETTCTACIDGYFSNSKTECEQCHSPCSTKCGGTDGKICYECDTGYYHTDNNECKQCDSLCLSCSGSTNNDCTSCKPGYHLIGTACTKCNSPCATCSESDGSHCLSCAKGYYLTGTTCGECSSDCGTCENTADQCTGCKEGFYLSGTKCNSCATGCATCDGQPSKCQSCISGYQLVGTSCNPCETGCATCEGSTTNCPTCIHGYYHQSDNTCHQCESPCATCTGPGNNTCKSCIKNYVLNGTICVIAPDDCEYNKHCEKDNKDGKEYLDYKVELPLHENYKNEESGGGIRLINYGFTGEDSTFKNCISLKGGGGGIFIYNNIQDTQSTYSINLKKLTFDSCKGYFGAGVYIYSPSEKSPVVIESCKFFSNEIYSTPNSDALSGGSAMYLTVKNGKVFDCSFADNKGPGGMMKVCEDFNERPEGLEMVKNNYTQGILLIKDCTFESKEGSGSSIYFSGEKLLSKVVVSDCKFTGNLAKDAHYIDGKLSLTEKSRVVIKSCQFDSDQNKALNSKFIKADLMNILLASNSFRKKNIQSNLWLTLPSIAVATLAVITFFVAKKRLNNDEADNTNNKSVEA